MFGLRWRPSLLAWPTGGQVQVRRREGRRTDRKRKLRLWEGSGGMVEEEG